MDIQTTIFWDILLWPPLIGTRMTILTIPTRGLSLSASCKSHNKFYRNQISAWYGLTIAFLQKDDQMLEKCQNGKDDEDDYQFSCAGIILAALHKSPLSVHLPHPSHHCRACRDYLTKDRFFLYFFVGAIWHRTIIRFTDHYNVILFVFMTKYFELKQNPSENSPVLRNPVRRHQAMAGSPFPSCRTRWKQQNWTIWYLLAHVNYKYIHIDISCM